MYVCMYVCMNYEEHVYELSWQRKEAVLFLPLTWLLFDVQGDVCGRLIGVSPGVALHTKRHHRMGSRRRRRPHPLVLLIPSHTSDSLSLTPLLRSVIGAKLRLTASHVVSGAVGAEEGGGHARPR